MNPFNRIFVAIDFSPASDEALRQAHERAESTGAELVVCHIVPNELRSNLLFPHLNPDAAMGVPVELERAAEAVANRVTEVTGRRGGDFTVVVEHGTPYGEVLKAAENWNADLIVIGSHGMTSAAGVLLGSVTHRIIRYAHCTVLVVRKPGQGAIVAGTDFSDPALPAISAAINEAHRTNRGLIVVHSVDLAFNMAWQGTMAYGGPPPTLEEDAYRAIQREAKERLLQALRKLGAEGEAVVAMEPAATALIAITRDRNASLLVVGTKGVTGLSRVLLGSVAESVASQAPCSVLITRLHAGKG